MQPLVTVWCSVGCVLQPCSVVTAASASIYSKLPAAKGRRKIDPTPRVPSNYTHSLPNFVSSVDKAEIRNVDMT
jgi:hypothetical protein